MFFNLLTCFLNSNRRLNTTWWLLSEKCASNSAFFHPLLLPFLATLDSLFLFFHKFFILHPSFLCHPFFYFEAPPFSSTHALPSDTAVRNIWRQNGVTRWEGSVMTALQSEAAAVFICHCYAETRAWAAASIMLHCISKFLIKCGKYPSDFSLFPTEKKKI